MSELPDLRLLRSFVVITEEGSISRAATRLHVAQQSLSAQIRVLERQMGAALLRRSNRGVKLTPVGEILLGEAIPLLGSAQRAMDLVARGSRGEDLELHIGFLSSLANESMPAVVSGLAERHPAVQLHTADLSIAELVAGVRSGSLDGAISRPPLIDDLYSDLLGSEGVVIALPEDHRYARKRRLRLKDLADEQWVMTPRSSWPPWHQIYDQDFAAAGYRPRVVRRSTSPQGLLALVAAGVGITRLAASARSLRTGGVRFVRLDGERADIVLLTQRRPVNPALTPFRAVVLDALTESIDGFQPA